MSSNFLKSDMFQRFATQRPIAVMTQMALTHLLDAKSLDRLFTEFSEDQYERTLMFSSLTKLVSGVVLGKHASVNAGYKKLKEQIGVSLTATYGKLQRVEPGLSQALVRHAYQQVVSVRKATGGIPQHDIAGYETKTLDGNHISGTEHRLKETRGITAAPLPGKSLVVFSPRHDAICDYFPIEDGHAQERSALDNVLETIQRDQLWIADRNFCTLKFIYGIFNRGGVFIIRHHEKLIGGEKGKLKKIGKTESGTVYEQTFQVSEHAGQTMTVRAVVIKLKEATRDGDMEMTILTNVPKDRADAVKIAQQYRSRWKIETVFQHLTESMSCEIKALCYPQAALFCFANALVAYNAFAIVKSAIGAAHNRETVSMLSHFSLAREILETTDGMLIALPVEEWACFREMASDKFVTLLIDVASKMNPRDYRKSIRGVKKPKPKKKHNNRVVHVSTKKILDKRNKTPC